MLGIQTGDDLTFAIVADLIISLAANLAMDIALLLLLPMLSPPRLSLWGFSCLIVDYNLDFRKG